MKKYLGRTTPSCTIALEMEKEERKGSPSAMHYTNHKERSLMRCLIFQSPVIPVSVIVSISILSINVYYQKFIIICCFYCCRIFLLQVYRAEGGIISMFSSTHSEIFILSSSLISLHSISFMHLSSQYNYHYFIEAFPVLHLLHSFSSSSSL